MDSRNDTIAAVATGKGGAIALIRVSGPDALKAGDKIFRAASGINLVGSEGYSMHYGRVTDDSRFIDEVIVSVFRSPSSYTGEDMIEISCHGSSYVQREILHLLSVNGVRSAEPGEFTVRAFLAGKMDLSQAEAVADMIASSDRASHRIATQQMKGGYSAEIGALRTNLLDFASLLELELDFSEEDVEFVERNRLAELISEITVKVDELIASFRLGNAIKEGIGVAIIGPPNVGKSTLLNALLMEDRAMVSDIPGTTRDTIEAAIDIEGVLYRFIDTAGIRETEDKIEKMGIERTLLSTRRADIILYVIEAEHDREQMEKGIRRNIEKLHISPEQSLYLVINKIDKLDTLTYERDWIESLSRRINSGKSVNTLDGIIPVSAKNYISIHSLTTALAEAVDREKIFTEGSIVSNARHLDSLIQVRESLVRLQQDLSQELAVDLVAQEIRQAIYYLSIITGEITTDEILGNIFAKFCIGK